MILLAHRPNPGAIRLKLQAQAAPITIKEMELHPVRFADVHVRRYLPSALRGQTIRDRITSKPLALTFNTVT